MTDDNEILFLQFVAQMLVLSETHPSVRVIGAQRRQGGGTLADFYDYALYWHCVCVVCGSTSFFTFSYAPVDLEGYNLLADCFSRAEAFGACEARRGLPVWAAEPGDLFETKVALRLLEGIALPYGRIP